MGNISENLTSLLNIKSDIKLAIEEKGQDLTGVSFDGYAGKIRDISTGENLIVTNDINFGSSTFSRIPNGWDFSEKTNFREVFFNCQKLKKVDGEIPFEKMKEASYAFADCYGLETIGENITIGDNQECYDFYEMFRGCTHLKYPENLTLNCAHITNLGDVCYPVGENAETSMDIVMNYPKATEIYEIPIYYNFNYLLDGENYGGFERLFLVIDTPNNISGGFSLPTMNVYDHNKSMTLVLDVGNRSHFNVDVDDVITIEISGIGIGDDSDELLENANWGFGHSDVNLSRNDFKNFTGTISFGFGGYVTNLPNYRANLNFTSGISDSKARELFNTLGTAFDGSTIRVSGIEYLSDDVIAIATSKGFIVERY